MGRIETGLSRVLIANRGEIAIRVARACADLGIESVAVHPDDEARSLHRLRCDSSVRLDGSGVSAYLDIDQILRVAAETGCDALHPGYGFLAESPELAQACAAAGVEFVGPSAETLSTLGDKIAARRLAEACGVPVAAGTAGPVDLAGAAAFFQDLGEHGAVMIKAVAGGGGRGMRSVRSIDALEEAFERSSSEAAAAFGDGSLYLEELIEGARHLEVQILGDGTSVVHLGERECSLQRRNQKIVEMAPSPALDPETRRALCDAAVAICRSVSYRSAATVEFLVAGDRFVFLEVNPRIQVEHTVTEAVTGVDLVQAQLRLAGGASLADLGLDPEAPPAAVGHAIQTRVNLETMGPDGTTLPTGGTLASFEPPSGPGVRVDTYGYAGYETNPRYDSLIAKVIVHDRTGLDAAIARADRALADFRLEPVATNLSLLRAILARPETAAGTATTTFIDDNAASLVEQASTFRPRWFAAASSTPPSTAQAGAQVDKRDPLAVLEFGRDGAAAAAVAGHPGTQSATPTPFVAGSGPEGTTSVDAPMQGTIVSVEVAVGAPVAVGSPVVVMEAMKMEHVITADIAGHVRALGVAAGDTIFEGHPLAHVEPAAVEVDLGDGEVALDLDHVRPDLAEVLDRHALGMDQRRPASVARRRKTGHRTARENIDDLCDPGSFIEYGSLVIAAQRRRREVEDLIVNTPADGMISGIGAVNGDLFAGTDVDTRTVLMSYDYTVLAGTQGSQNHRKKDRLFELARNWQIPLVFYAEGGGGRPGDTDGLGVAGLDCLAFALFGELSGLVPLVGITTGRCFAGNAALLGCCDVVIATKGSNIGMGGPAMVEGGNLGVFTPEEIGPVDVQRVNGVVDIAVEDEAEATAMAKKYLSYFQGSLPTWEAADQRRLRSAIPENRLRIYDVRAVIELLADTDSVLELRKDFGLGMVTSLARIEGRPIGIVANNPTHLAGAIDADAADKAARFMQLCDAYDLPILFLCDTPGIMVGPEVEKTALVRHAARMFVTGASLTVPMFTIVLRKGYGLGAQAMAAGSFKAPFFTVSWPTGEFGGMGLEGAVKLGYRKELEAETDPEARLALYTDMVDRMYQRGKAVNVASHFEIDDVIDPMDSRHWIGAALAAAGTPTPRQGKKRPCIDTW